LETCGFGIENKRPHRPSFIAEFTIEIAGPWRCDDALGDQVGENADSAETVVQAWAGQVGPDPVPRRDAGLTRADCRELTRCAAKAACSAKESRC